MHDFKSSLAKGHEGEIYMQSLFPKWRRTDGYKEDLITEDGKLVEIKTESRTTEQTPNVALEWASSPGRPGAIERACKDGVTYLIYLFADKKYFVYDPVKVWAFMRKNYAKYRRVSIVNPTYYSTVLLVPRADLEDCHETL